MPRYAAFLRGVMPTNAKMPALREAFEAAGFTGVETVLSSGNVVFDAAAARESTIERKAEAAMEARLGRAFPTIVRPLEELRALVAADPYRSFQVQPAAKRIVTFLRTSPTATIELPIELDGAVILGLQGQEVFSAYEPSPKGPVFMVLIERTFGKDVTTRTWDTVMKVAARVGARAATKSKGGSATSRSKPRPPARAGKRPAPAGRRSRGGSKR